MVSYWHLFNSSASIETYHRHRHLLLEEMSNYMYWQVQWRLRTCSGKRWRSFPLPPASLILLCAGFCLTYLQSFLPPPGLLILFSASCSVAASTSLLEERFFVSPTVSLTLLLQFSCHFSTAPYSSFCPFISLSTQAKFSCALFLPVSISLLLFQFLFLLYQSGLPWDPSF